MKDLHKLFKKESAEYEKFRLKSIKAQIKYDDAIANVDGETLKRIRQDLDDALKREDAFVDSYAQKVFQILSREKPVLLRRRDKTLVPWEDAFGNDYSQLSPERKGSLVALIEEDGGQYRLQQ